MLYFLDDEESGIFGFVNNSRSGYSKFDVYINDELIFVGNTYSLAGTVCHISLRDIFNEYIISNNIKYFYNDASTDVVLLNVLVKIYAPNAIKKSGAKWNITRKIFATIPYINKCYEDYLKNIYNDDSGDYNYRIINLLQTTDEKNFYDEYVSYTDFIPHIPYVKSENFGFKQLFWSKYKDEPDNVSFQWYFGDIPTSKFDALEYSEEYCYKLTSPLTEVFEDKVYDKYLFATNSYLPEETSIKQYIGGEYVDGVKINNGYLFSNINANSVSVRFIDEDGTALVSNDYNIGSGAKHFDYYHNSDIKTIRISMYDNGAKGAPNNEVAYIEYSAESLTDGKVYRFDLTIGNTNTIANVAISDRYFTKIAEVDECPAKYYLMWQDRLGGVQCQGFDGKSSYSETFTYTTGEDYSGHKNIINTSVKPKWSLNTKLITDEYYSLYECIYTSPTVILYDVDNDKVHNVLPTGKSFKEKTWKSEKKVYNFSIDVEKNIEEKLLV